MADYVSVLTGGSNNFDTTSEHLNALATDILEDGVVGSVGNTAGVAPMTGGLACNAQGTPNMTVAVTAGKCYVTATPSGQSSQRLRANIAAQNATIAANSTGGTRYDWIYVKIDATTAANPAAAGDDVASIVVSRSTSSSTDNGTPPTYGYPIAVVTVANGASSITNGNIADVRDSVEVTNNATTAGWTNLGSTPDTITYSGKRNYSMVFNSVDHTDVLSPGMKLKISRTVAAPTQCTDLESSSSQYYNKTSPNKLTFTDDFVCSAWIKLESYTGSDQAIISRYNGTSGWRFMIDVNNRIVLQGFNGGAANFSYIMSYAAVPLNKWVHVSAQLDMSAFTATTTTSYVMFDGIDVPAFVSRGGTNPTALVQAGNLEVGSANATTFFDGKIAQPAVFNAKVTQATMLGYISQGLSGTETSLASAYSFNNSLADLNTTTPNDLTAQNGAVATATDSPFAARIELAGGVTAGTTEYAEITSVSFSTNTTVTARVPESCAIPTSGGISAIYYSVQENPFGFPYLTDVLDMALMSINHSMNSMTRAEISGLKINISIPPGRAVKLSQYTMSIAGTAGDVASFEIHDTSVSGSANIVQGADVSVINSTGPSIYLETIERPNTTTGVLSKVYVGGFVNNTAARSIAANANLTSTYRRPMWLKAELI